MAVQQYTSANPHELGLIVGDLHNRSACECAAAGRIVAHMVVTGMPRSSRSTSSSVTSNLAPRPSRSSPPPSMVMDRVSSSTCARLSMPSNFVLLVIAEHVGCAEMRETQWTRQRHGRAIAGGDNGILCLFPGVAGAGEEDFLPWLPLSGIGDINDTVSGGHGGGKVGGLGLAAGAVQADGTQHVEDV